MHRPDRRTRRTLAGVLATVTTLALIWPVAIVSGRAASPASIDAPTVDARKSDREASVHGLGVKPLKGNGSKRTTPLQQLGVDQTKRGDGAGKDGGIGIQAVPPASVQATSSGAPAATSFGPWEGLDQATTGNLEPPDPWVAVGPDDVVQTVNEVIRFTNREGASTADDVELFDFFAFDELVPGDPTYIDGIGDPRFIYDAKHNRWFGMTLAWHCDTDGAGLNDDSIGYVWGAISTTADPTGSYYQFYVNYNTFLPDSPAVGTSGDKFAITANEYVLDNTADCTHAPTAACVRSDIEPFLPPGCFDGASITTFDWNQMLTFPGLPDITYDFDIGWFSLRAALSPQSSSNTLFIVGEKLLPNPTGLTTSNVAYMTVTGTNAGGGTTLTAERDLTNLGIVPAFVDPPAPTDPGGQFDADIIDRRPTDAIWQDNVLTFASTTKCDPAGGSVENRNCARVTQVRTTTATPARVQDILVATSGKDTWYPGIGQSSSGILHVVYTQSSASEGMSSYDRYQLPSDAIHKLSAPRKTADGGSVAYPGERWGDYVGVAQDPRDTNAVWQGNQYTKSNGTWGTRVSELQTAGTTFVPMAPRRLLDSRTNLGTSGAFVSGVPKTVPIAGRGGVPDDAVAITGNLTVTGQQQAGYGSLTVLPNANPSTSTINFPVGDTRANNVTSPLSASGGVSLVYKAGAGKTAHFLLDVTGYFLNDATGDTYKVLAPVRVLDTRDDVGLNGPVPVNSNREFEVAGAFGVPANADAVTGNLTVTGQTGAGFVTLSSTPPPTSPATSTINFPLGDVRANGVTIKLSTAGSIHLVYKSNQPGKSTHLVFDVTGYYVDDLTGARFVPLTPGRRLDSRTAAPQEGLTGPFVASTAKTLIIEPYQGTPANATAITGNLTVVGQTRAGYVSMTQATTNNPQTSTLNFPLGDVRANGVTGPLTGAGSVGLVYKASSGSTHLVLDLTGYFR